MTTITLNLDWLSNEGLAVLLNQLEALPDNGPDGAEINSAWLDAVETLNSRVGKGEMDQLQTDLDILLDAAASRAAASADKEE